MSIYTLDLKDSIPEDADFSLTIAVGNFNIQCRFLWDTATEEQYEELIRDIARLSATDPIGPELKRNYSWPEYYMQFEGLTDEEIEAYLDANADNLPSSFKGLTTYQRTVLIKERLSQSLDYAEQLLLYQELMRWQVTIRRGDTSTVSVVQIGGWYDFDSELAFRFVSDGRTYIGSDDLQYVQMEFQVNE